MTHHSINSPVTLESESAAKAARLDAERARKARAEEERDRKNRPAAERIAERLTRILGEPTAFVGVHATPEAQAAADAIEAAKRALELRDSGCPETPTGQKPSRRERRVAVRVCRDMVAGSLKTGERGSSKHKRRGSKRSRPKAGSPKQTRGERRKAKAAAADKRMARQQLAWVAEHELEGKPLDFIPNEIWAWVQAVCRDSSGACARHFLRHCPNKIFAGAIRKAALIPCEGRCGVGASCGGQCGDYFDWEDRRARDVVAVGALLFHMAVQVKTRDGEWHRKRWGSIVTGVTRNLILEALYPKERHRKTTGYLTGTYGWGGLWCSRSHARGGERGPGCGLIVALEQCGVLYRDPWQGQGFATSSGYQPNQYWITSCTPEYGRDNEDSARRMGLFDGELGDEYEDLLHERPGPFDVYQPPGPEPPC